MTKCHPDIVCGKSFQELPVKRVGHLSARVCATYTGPYGGLTTVRRRERERHVDATDPDLGFIDDDDVSCGRTAQLAQQEDLEEFMQDGNHNGHTSTGNGDNHQTTTRTQQRRKGGTKCGGDMTESRNSKLNGNIQIVNTESKTPGDDVRWQSDSRSPTSTSTPEDDENGDIPDQKNCQEITEETETDSGKSPWLTG